MKLSDRVSQLENLVEMQDLKLQSVVARDLSRLEPGAKVNNNYGYHYLVARSPTFLNKKRVSLIHISTGRQTNTYRSIEELKRVLIAMDWRYSNADL